MFLVHFKSRDLTRLHKQGQFWHIFFTTGTTIIAQDEVDTWTIHTPVPVETDVSVLDPRTAIYKGLGTLDRPYPIDVDEILVTSSWRPNICLADRYISDKGRVFLSGDSAHQNIPTGGYGMNTAVGDSFDIGWKLAAVLAGHGGPQLLKSYESERRPVAMRNINRSGEHGMVHHVYREWCREDPQKIYSQTDAAQQLKERIAKHVTQHDGENKDHGIEMGYRYDSPAVLPDEDATEPPHDERLYHPGTFPGARAPHVFLADGKTSIFDHFGKGQEYTLVDFTQDGRHAKRFHSTAKTLNVPLRTVHLPDESHVHRIWERDAVLVRPDDHVAWRSPLGSREIDVDEVLFCAVGRQEIRNMGNGAYAQMSARVKEKGFASTVGNVDQNKVDGFAEFQK
jgi:FAD-dependent monooxygenase